jgi:hypothetical protein
MFLLNLLVLGQVGSRDPKDQGSKPPTGGEVRIPYRSTQPLFQGKQGNQKTDIRFDPASRLVTIRPLVQDPSGYFIPNIRRENFVVYENNVRQQNVGVEIEHATVSLLVLMEYGGRSAGFNNILSEQISRASHELLDVLIREDRVALWILGTRRNNWLTSRRPRHAERLLLHAWEPWDFWDLYDAVIAGLERMRPVTGCKAILLLSSGIDTFSKASLDDALKGCSTSETPIMQSTWALACTKLAVFTASAV